MTTDNEKRFPIGKIENTQIKDEELPEKDRFRLAKTILLLSVLIYVSSAGLYIFGDHILVSDSSRIVWQFSSQAIFGMVNLIIGFYFGRK